MRTHNLNVELGDLGPNTFNAFPLPPFSTCVGLVGFCGVHYIGPTCMPVWLKVCLGSGGYFENRPPTLLVGFWQSWFAVVKQITS